MYNQQIQQNEEAVYGMGENTGFSHFPKAECPSETFDKPKWHKVKK